MENDERKRPKYYVLENYGKNRDGKRNRMMTYSTPNPSGQDRWLRGHKFVQPPATPVVAIMQPGEEHCDLMPFYTAAVVMSDEFYQALCAAGVDNIDVYDAVLRSEDGTIEYKGYKAYNILGVIRAADMNKTIFNDPPGSKLIDASIENLEIDADKARGILMFRLAENVSAIIVHERVKRFIEPMNFPYVQFNETKLFSS